MTLEYITDDSLDPFQHGFFTRLGGASSGIFEGLNCGFGSSDQREVVEINRARVADKMNVAVSGINGLHQTHSADVITITEAPHDNAAKADGLVTAQSGIALAILTADCQPVLFADSDAGVIGAAHAGWKGALDGVLDATVDAMVKIGAVRENISAVIGPSISQRAYEVGPEFMDRFYDLDPENARFFANGKDDRYQFDLPAFGLHRLRGTGIKSSTWTRHCTYSDPDRFYSYRRSVHSNEADYGRLISVIRK